MTREQELALLQGANAARKNAYVPHSRFRVGAALLTTSGQIFAGANVDNASFPMTSCAEANAIGAMVTAGHTVIEAILVIGGAEQVATEICTPCGGCRQQILEFAQPGTVVLLANTIEILDRVLFMDLLPRSFALRTEAVVIGA